MKESFRSFFNVFPRPGVFRFLLALLVVLHHSTPLRLGAWAVYVFFILSGYWIARTWDERYRWTRTPRLTFLVSRWWRLAPVFFVCLAAAAVLLPMWGRPIPRLTADWALRQILVLGSAFRPNLLPPQWALDVEMQFYVVAAVFLPWWMTPHRLSFSARRMTALVGLIFVGLSLLYLSRGGAAEFSQLWAWIGFFVVGMWIWHSDWKPNPTMALASLYFFLAMTLLLLARSETRNGLLVKGADVAQTHFAHWPAVWQAIGALLIVPFIAVNVRMPSSEGDRLLGNLAYPLYLFHWIPREWYYANVDWLLPWWRNAGLLALNIGGALAGSFVILRLVDRPIDRLRVRWVKGRMMARQLS